MNAKHVNMLENKNMACHVNFDLNQNITIEYNNYITIELNWIQT